MGRAENWQVQKVGTNFYNKITFKSKVCFFIFRECLSMQQSFQNSSIKCYGRILPMHKGNTVYIQSCFCWLRNACLLQVKLADRSLLPGDVVKFSNVRKGAQKGFVSNVEVVASVKVLVANQIFHNVDCKELSPLQVYIVVYIWFLFENSSSHIFIAIEIKQNWIWLKQFWHFCFRILSQECMLAWVPGLELLLRFIEKLYSGLRMVPGTYTHCTLLYKSIYTCFEMWLQQRKLLF